MNGGSGTIYYKLNDTLLMDNGELNSTAFTIVKIPENKVSVNENQQQLAKKLYLQNGARVLLFGDHKDICFDTLHVSSYSWLELSHSLDRCHVHITNSTYISSTATVDFSNTKWVGIYPAENVTDITIGNVNYREMFGIVGQNINLVGKIHLAAEFTHNYAWQSKVIMSGQNITLFNEAEIFGGYNLLHANHTIELLTGSKILSLRNNTCNTDVESKEMFRCIDKYSLEQALSQEYLLDRYTDQFPGVTKYEGIDTMLHGLLTNYTTYLAANERVLVTSAAIEGPRIGICTTNFTMIDSQLEASGKGCLGDEGLHKGKQTGDCAGSGGANGGYGGYGGIENESNSEHLAKCKDHFPEPYQMDYGANYEGSGGASSITGSSKGGSGGGIIRVNVLDTIDLQ